MEENIKFKRILRESGGGQAINIPQELLQYINIKQGEELTLTGDKSKHGKFIAIWKGEQE